MSCEQSKGRATIATAEIHTQTQTQEKTTIHHCAKKREESNIDTHETTQKKPH
jgi:hypothetical protein